MTPTKRKRTKAKKRKAAPVETAKPEVEKKPPGRPKVQLDAAQIEALAKINCTHAEIAAVMKCSTDTIARHFADDIRAARQMGKTSLRRAMWKSALGGSVPMMTWLSKQELGMKDQSKVQTQDIKPRVVSYMPDNRRDPQKRARAGMPTEEQERAAAAESDNDVPFEKLPDDIVDGDDAS